MKALLLLALAPGLEKVLPPVFSPQVPE